MASHIQRILWLLAGALLRRQKRAAVQLARIKAATWYVQGVRSVRVVFVAYTGLLAMVGFFVSGLILLPIGLFVLLPWSLEARALFLVILGAVYLLVPLLAFMWLSRERLWMRATGADKAVKKAIAANKDSRGTP